MKYLSSVAAAFAFVALPAAAQDSAFITQVDSVGNTAIIEQIATRGGNYATIDQIPGAFNGSGSIVQLLQEDVGGSTARVNQAGEGNDYTVRQFHGDNLQAFVDTRTYWEGGLGGSNNIVSIEQSGTNASAWVDHGGGASFNRAEIVQIGSGGRLQADVAQYSSGNVASIYQYGSNLDASIIQSGGYGNVATIRQGYGGVAVR